MALATYLVLEVHGQKEVQQPLWLAPQPLPERAQRRRLAAPVAALLGGTQRQPGRRAQ